MCGICGFVTKKITDQEIIREMIRAVNHRGPDDSGSNTAMDHSGLQVTLGQARLSIIDLSPGGHQPMFYRHYSIIFNGEIYNYQEIKATLVKLGHQFASGSDTEVILHAFEEWEMDCVTRFIGMFAFVIHDSQKSKLFCCRDRAGAKPFYYYLKNDCLIFGSELKVFHKHPQFEKKINLKAVELFFRYMYIPAPFTIFEDTHKLEAGNWLLYDLSSGGIEIKKYWSIVDAYSKEQLKISYEDAKEELKKILISSCNYRMVADVPVGIFLSGGYDSSLVASIVQQGSSQSLKSFTIGFEEGNNEAPFAKQTAAYLGMDHTEYYCTQMEAVDIIQELPYIFDEPFADSSAIPTILVSRLAAKQVKVALSADAGDEVFVGYNRYVSLYSNNKKLNAIPSFLKKTASLALNVTSTFIPEKKQFLKHKIGVFSHALAEDIQSDSINLFDGMLSTPPLLLRKLIKDSNAGYHLFFPPEIFLAAKNKFESALAYDYFLYLQNDILTKVDKAAMSVSLEGREPLLDHRIVEFAATLPIEYKFDGSITKKILKDITYDYLPKEMMKRPKAGFSIPINKWLKSNLGDMIDREINYDEIRKQGILDPDFVKSIVEAFKANNFFYEQLIWKVLQFQMWYNKWMK